MCWYIPQTFWNPFEYIAKLTTSQITVSDHCHLNDTHFHDCMNLGGCWVQMRWAICRARLEARVRGVACVFLWFSKEVAVSFWKVLGNFLRWKTDEMNMTCCHIQVFSHPKVHSCWVTGLLSCEISHLWEVKMGKKRWASNEIKWYRNIIVLLMVQKSEPTTWGISNLVNTGISTTATGAGFLPSTVCLIQMFEPFR